MSYLDLDELTPEHLIVQYVIECRGSGHFLPYLDHQVIEDWLKSAADPEELLVVLADVLPPYFAGSNDPRRPKPLSGVRHRVLKVLRERASRQDPI